MFGDENLEGLPIGGIVVPSLQVAAHMRSLDSSLELDA